MRLLRSFLACVAMSMVVLTGGAFGDSSQISYQGRLTNTEGNPVVDNVYAFKFAVYDAPVGGNQLWSSIGFVPIDVKDGLFSHMLGSTNPMPDTLAEYDSLWLGITVGLDPEMTPRTRLASSMYSFKAKQSRYADTARHSLDKTTNASELIAGDLDTARYSAYNDLLSENRIGEGNDQVAPGNHSHIVSGIVWAEDTTWIDVYVTAADGNMTLKSITLPAGGIKGHFRIFWYVWLFGSSNCGDGQIQVKLLANDDLIEESSTQVEGIAFLRTASFYNPPNTVQFMPLSMGGFEGAGVTPPRQIEIDPSEPVEIKITAQAVGTCTFQLRVGTLVVEYKE